VALGALLLISCGSLRQLQGTLGELAIVRAKVAQKLSQLGVHADNVVTNLGPGPTSNAHLGKLAA